MYSKKLRHVYCNLVFEFSTVHNQLISFAGIVDEYQEQPHLIDPYLGMATGTVYEIVNTN